LNVLEIFWWIELGLAACVAGGIVFVIIAIALVAVPPDKCDPPETRGKVAEGYQLEFTPQVAVGGGAGAQSHEGEDACT
jgi:hypothetical protein